MRCCKAVWNWLLLGSKTSSVAKLRWPVAGGIWTKSSWGRCWGSGRGWATGRRSTKTSSLSSKIGRAAGRGAGGLAISGRVLPEKRATSSSKLKGVNWGRGRPKAAGSSCCSCWGAGWTRAGAGCGRAGADCGRVMRVGVSRTWAISRSSSTRELSCCGACSLFRFCWEMACDCWKVGRGRRSAAACWTSGLGALTTAGRGVLTGRTTGRLVATGRTATGSSSSRGASAWTALGSQGLPVW